MLSLHFNKNNLHHACLIEGDRTKILPEVFSFCENIGIKITGNPDFYSIHIDNLKIDEAFKLREMAGEKSFSGEKKIFCISINQINKEAQQVLLKIFEEPSKDTHFFIIIPDKNILLKTILSRFYIISEKQDIDLSEIEKFIKMSLQLRLDFVKELTKKEKEENLNENTDPDSSRSKSLRFLDSLESYLSKKEINTKIIEHIFKIRSAMQMPGSSPKMLLESIALIL